MFKQKQTSKSSVDTLIGAATRINGDVEFDGGFHLDGYINGDVRCAADSTATLSVSERGCIEGSVSVPNIKLNGVVKGDIDALDRVELGPKARVLGSVSYATIESAVGAQINGKLVHRTTAVAGPAQPEAEQADVSAEPSTGSLARDGLARDVGPKEDP